MTVEIAVELARKTMETTLVLAAPILITAMVVSVAINVIQVLTSVQEPMVSTVPRLVVTLAAGFLLTPWILRRLAAFALYLLSDFRPYIR